MKTRDKLRLALKELAGIKKVIPNTELHHCWTIEKRLTYEQKSEYADRLSYACGGEEFKMLHAGWQTRAKLLQKVLK